MAFEYDIGQPVALIIYGRIAKRTECDVGENEYLVDGKSAWGAPIKRWVSARYIRPIDDPDNPTTVIVEGDNDSAPVGALPHFVTKAAA